MGTTRKLAIKAFQETHPELRAKKELSGVRAPGQFLGMTVAFAASCITSASAQNGTGILPDETGYGPTVAPLDVAAVAAQVATMGVCLLIVFTAFIGYRAVRQFATGARIEPLIDVAVINNPGVQSPEVVLEMKAPATNPTTPVALTEKELAT